MEATVDVLGPTTANHTLGRSGWGLAVAAHGVGMVAGGVLGLRFRPCQLPYFGCACMFGEVPTPLTLALAPRTGAMVVIAFLAGVALEQFGIAWRAALQQEIPPERLARVSSYDALGSFAASTIAMVAVRDVRTLRTTTTSMALIPSEIDATSDRAGAV